MNRQDAMTPETSILFFPCCRFSWRLGAVAVVLGHAKLRGTGVSRQPFAARELGRYRAELHGRLARDADHARALLEVVDAERRGEARRARRRQHVVGPRAVVSERFRA